MRKLKQYIETNLDRFLDELFDLLRIPSVSTKPEHKKDIQTAAKKIEQYILQAGADNAEVIPTHGHPVVIAEKVLDPSLPTILIYGHYDVQPPEPLELWHSPPFEPEIREGKIYARGADDDKGQLFTHIKAFEFLVKEKYLNCNVKFLIEGEEEIGSPNLKTFCRANKDQLKSDIILVSDTNMIAEDTPSITVGLRGMSYMEVEVSGANRDLHSGIFGGAVINPIITLSKMIAGLSDEDNKITLPGFYDDVQILSDEERKELARIPFNEIDYKKNLGIEELVGETGYSTLEQTTIRPSLSVCGIWGGYSQQGPKTIIPAKAHAKISMRLVPEQKSEKICNLFYEYFVHHAPKGVSVKVETLQTGEAYVSPIDSIGYQAASKAIEASFGKKPIATRSGGTIPVISTLEEVLGIKSILLGFGLESNAIHSPNENFPVSSFVKGIETIPLFYKYYCDLYKD